MPRYLILHPHPSVCIMHFAELHTFLWEVNCGTSLLKAAWMLKRKWVKPNCERFKASIQHSEIMVRATQNEVPLGASL